MSPQAELCFGGLKYCSCTYTNEHCRTWLRRAVRDFKSWMILNSSVRWSTVFPYGAAPLAIVNLSSIRQCSPKLCPGFLKNQSSFIILSKNSAQYIFLEFLYSRSHSEYAVLITYDYQLQSFSTPSGLQKYPRLIPHGTDKDMHHFMHDRLTDSRLCIT